MSGGKLNDRLQDRLNDTLPVGPPKPRKRRAVKTADSGILARAGVGSQLELRLLNRMLRAGLPEPARQFPFCEGRKWAADFAYTGARLLIEVDGGSWVGGRHTQGQGFEDDCEKLSVAAALGYRVIRVTGRMISDGRAVRLIAQALGVRTR